MEFIEDENIIFWKENNILYSKFTTKKTKLDYYNTKKFIELRHQISNNEKQYWCCHLNGIIGFSKDGQKHADEYGQEFLYACGVVVYSHLAKFLVNLFVRVKKPHVPLKYFTDEKKALHWLEEQREKNNQNQQS